MRGCSVQGKHDEDSQGGSGWVHTCTRPLPSAQRTLLAGAPAAHLQRRGQAAVLLPTAGRIEIFCAIAGRATGSGPPKMSRGSRFREDRQI
jgi:hypothetical protein